MLKPAVTPARRKLVTARAELARLAMRYGGGRQGRRQQEVVSFDFFMQTFFYFIAYFSVPLSLF